MLEILHHSLIDTVKLFPWLLLIYIIIELLERKTNLAGSKSRFGGSLGPLVGSATIACVVERVASYALETWLIYKGGVEE